MASLLRTKPTTPLNPHAITVQPNRIGLVEDQPVVSSGLSAWINQEQDLQVCGIAQNYASALEMMEALNPDLIISDIGLSGRDGLELLKAIKIRRRQQRVLILSAQDESLYAPRALRAGASGYVMRHASMETLLTAIHKVLGGEIYLSEAMGKRMIQRLFDKPTPALDLLEPLSDRELAVFRMIGQVKSTREIATELQLSIKTVEAHRAHLRKKLHLTNGRELLRHALSRQLDEARVERDSSDAVQGPAQGAHWRPVAVERPLDGDGVRLV
jgi:DNA-binding NarL/FixJ family response regulator